MSKYFKLFSEPITTVLIALLGIFITFFLTFLFEWDRFDCDVKIMQMQTDSLQRSLTLEQGKNDSLKSSYVFHKGVIIQLNPKLNILKNEIVDIKIKIRQAILQGKNYDYLKSLLLEKEIEYSAELDVLTDKMARKSFARHTNQNLDSLTNILDNEIKRKQNLQSEYKKKCDGSK